MRDDNEREKKVRNRVAHCRDQFASVGMITLAA